MSPCNPLGWRPIGPTPSTHNQSSFRGDRFRLFLNRSVRPTNVPHPLLPDSQEPLAEASVLMGECLSASAVPLHKGLDQQAMLIPLKQHELPNRLGTSLRQPSGHNDRVRADELIADLPPQN